MCDFLMTGETKKEIKEKLLLVAKLAIKQGDSYNLESSLALADKLDSLSVLSMKTILSKTEEEKRKEIQESVKNLLITKLDDLLNSTTPLSFKALFELDRLLDILLKLE